jgi:AI-2 transport protein TqsA
VRNYVYITTIVGLVTGAFDTILFIILVVDFAVLWGVLAFLLSYIPSLGFWLAAIPPTILALLESGPGVAALTFLGIVLINGFAENVIKPKYMGKGLNLITFHGDLRSDFLGCYFGTVRCHPGSPNDSLVQRTGTGSR